MKGDEDPLRIGVSSCLLGQEVRFDGGHKRNLFLLERLDPFVEWVPVCPEVEAGMGIPRPSVRLERHAAGVRMIAPRTGEVVAFHTAHKLQLMAHSPQAYRELGRLVGDHKRLERADFQREYEAGFMQALAKKATPGRTTNVLQHMAGYLREHLEPALRTELRASIEDYREGLVPLIVPVTLLHHHARRFEIEYLLGQVFLSPHPKELMLRNHA